ncbi:hypothetical protein [Cohnella caldifontis]|uniref:hypothetical protein n=1 Tax=Cohnella caldifontis TaxID=3027471 RepID=UPI0023EC2CB6|nr:hypothetical protein [Cohnella sp. YIM B05605]
MNVRKGIRGRTIAAALAAAIALWAGAALPAGAAAAPALTATQQKAFDGTVSSADAALADKLKTQHAEYLRLKTQSLDWEQKIAAAHSRNAKSMESLRQRIRQVDAAKLAAMKKDAEDTRKRHQKLFDLYQNVNAQLKTAKKLKSKSLVSVLSLQADGMKIPVHLAREEIKAKNSAYESARKAAQGKMKKLRNSLAAADPVLAQIRASKSALSAPNDGRRTVWNAFTKSLGKRDAKSACEFLASVNALTRQIVDRQQKIYALEERVAAIIRDTEKQLSA